MIQPYNHPLDPSQRLVYEATPADMMQWSHQYPFGNTATFNQELETYLPQNVYIAPTGSTPATNELILEARNTGGGNASVGNGKYTSGMIASYNKLSVLYGYIEGCIKFPAGTGVWPAFWMLYTSVQQINEIDICEIFESGTSLNCGVHFPGGATHDGGPYTVADMSAGYHYYAVDWQPGYVAFYFDGVPLFRTETPSEIPNQLMYILANIAVSGVAVNDHIPADSQFPIDMHIKYIRIWQGYPSASTPYQLARTVTQNYASYDVAVQLDGAANHYYLNETSGTTATDSIGGKNGTITGGVTLGQTAIIGDGSKSMLFDGSTGYVALPNTVTTTGLSALTVELWFMNPTKAGRIMSNGHTDQDNTGFQLALNSLTQGLTSLATTAKTSNLYWAASFTTGVPNHYVLVYTGSNVYAYLNGVQVGSDTLTGTIVASSNAINIGRGGYGNDYYAGLLGHVSIYPSLAFTATQVQSHYNAGLASINSVASLSITPTAATVTGTIPTYDIGDLVRCSGTFTSGGSAIDPATVVARVKAPDGTISTYEYGTDGALLKDGIGTYHVDIFPNQSGAWSYRFEGTGSLGEAVETVFNVRASTIV
jgi:beta-glucanase (GH16 family)